MGSKRYMLRNGLGEKIRELGGDPGCTRFVDLFTGSGAVAHYAAENLGKPVLASDIQMYAISLAGAVTMRDVGIDNALFESTWLSSASKRLRRSKHYKKAVQFSSVASGPKLRKQVSDARVLCETPVKIGPIWGAYGGYYFSPLQALTLDYLRKGLPQEEPFRGVALAALIVAASRCAAAPGHTAQPFKPSETGGQFLIQAWNKDIFSAVRAAIAELAPKHASVKGEVQLADALTVATQLKATDLVFVDPPYSSVHYSRFYHVLETIAQGKCGSVDGVGRYPNSRYRPSSKFSLVRSAMDEFEKLLEVLSETRSTVLLTFPEGMCSNGVSGAMIEKAARKWFDIEVMKKMHGSFSTLGGKKQGEGNRLARQKSTELLFVMRPLKPSTYLAADETNISPIQNV